ncbi:MAG: pyridoxal phosphate-dependent aminotransferase [Hyphomicrobiales bacterium]|nr:pyridoxal phosphate-dependent aminotransferase [Hyphomicrobiales bacterium]
MSAWKKHKSGEHPAAVARRAREISEPATLRMSAKVRELRQAGVEIVNLTIGEPDFDTPDAVKDAAKAALDAGQTKYSPIAGIAELRQAAAEKLRRDNGLMYDADEIVVANGAKQAITNCCMAFLEPGDEVIIPAPYWAAYPSVVEFSGGRPVFVKTRVREGFKLTPAALAAALTPKSKLLMLNSPSNPAGAVYTRAELAGLIDVALAHPQLWIMSDEIYERIDFTGRHASVATLPGAWARTVTINGVSKAFAMTGWRIGYTAAPMPVSVVLRKIQATLTGGANPFAQAAAAFALRGAGAATERMRAAYQARRDLVLDLLHKVPDVRVSRPDGAFYAFPDVSAYFGRTVDGRTITDSTEMADYFLDAARVSTVPGAGFGDDRCIRISTAASEAELREGLSRVAGALAALR